MASDSPNRAAPGLDELLGSMRSQGKVTPQEYSVFATPLPSTYQAKGLIRARFPGIDEDTVEKMTPTVRRNYDAFFNQAAQAVPDLPPTLTPSAQAYQTVNTSRPKTPGPEQEAWDEFQAQETERINEGFATAVALGALPAGAGAAAVGLGASALAGVGVSTLAAGAGQAGLDEFFGDEDMTLEERGGRILKAMAWEGGGGVVGLGIGKALSAVLTGSRAARDVNIATLKELDMTFAIQEVADTPLADVARRVLGAVPILNKPFKRRMLQQDKAFHKAVEKTVSELSPDVALMRKLVLTRSADEVADIQQALTSRSFEKLDDALVMASQRSSALHDEAATLAEAAGLGRIKLSHASVVVKETLDDLVGQGILIRRVVKPTKAELRLMGAAPGAKIKKIVKYDVRPDVAQTPLGRSAKFVADFAKRGNFADRAGLRGMKKSLSSAINENVSDPEAVRMLGKIKGAIEGDVTAFFQRDPAAFAKYAEANKVSEEFLNMLGDALGNRAKKYNRLAGRMEQRNVGLGSAEVAKNTGSDPIALLDNLLQTKSTREIDQLYEFLKRAHGEKEATAFFGDMAALKISRAFEHSMKEAVEKSLLNTFDSKQFLKALGLGKAGTAEYTTAVRMFQKSGVSLKRVQAIADGMQLLYGPKQGKPGEMLVRRTLLNGLGSATRALVPGATAGAVASGGTSLVGAGMGVVGTWVIGRAVGSIFTSPRLAKAFITLTNLSAQESARSRALVSIMTDPLVWDGLFDTAAVGAANVVANERAYIEGKIKELTSPAKQAEALREFDEFIAPAKKAAKGMIR